MIQDRTLPSIFGTATTMVFPWELEMRETFLRGQKQIQQAERESLIREIEGIIKAHLRGENDTTLQADEILYAIKALKNPPKE